MQTAKRTDADGQYTILLRDLEPTTFIHPGVLAQGRRQYSEIAVGVYGGSVTVQKGDVKTLNISSYEP
jgi:hypothetical protein